MLVASVYIHKLRKRFSDISKGLVIELPHILIKYFTRIVVYICNCLIRRAKATNGALQKVSICFLLVGLELVENISAKTYRVSTEVGFSQTI